MKVRLVGEKAALEGLSLELGGRFCPELLVVIGVRPRREVCLPVHTEFCVLVLLEPDVAGLLDDKGVCSLAEDEGVVMCTALEATTWRAERCNQCR